MVVYLFLFMILVASIALKNPKVIGYLGEQNVRRRLNQLDPKTYIILHDILVPSNSGKTSQIDHIVISEFGIFVIETKNYKGWIFGQEKSQYWTQIIFKRKEKLRNPIWQNKGHIKALKEILADKPEVPYHNIVVFTDQAKLKLETNSVVIHASQLVHTIKTYTQKVLSVEQLQSIHQCLNSYNQQGKIARKEHIETIQKDIQTKTLKVAEMICPRCEGELVERKGKYGSFIGCSNYPKCRFIVKDRKVVGIQSYRR